MGIFLFWHSWSLSCCCIGIEAALCARVNAGTSRRSWNSLLQKWHFILLWFIPIYVYLLFFSSFDYVYDGYLLFFFLEQLWILKVLQMEINNNSSIIINFFFWDAYILEGRWYYFFSSKSKNSFGTKYVCVTVWMCIFIVVIDGRYWMKINDFLFGAVLTGKC